MRVLLSSVLAVVFALAVSACDSASPDPITPEPLDVVLVQDLPADPTTGRDPQTGAPIATNRYTLFSLRENRIVLGYNAESRADSASTQWDIGFRGTSLIVNGGQSGPGQGGAVLVSGLLDEVTEAPAAGYGDAVPGDWFAYNPQTHVVSPTPGRVIVVRTANGQYAKLRVLSYYRGAPADPDAFEHEARHYTFEYVLQPDGSRFFPVD